MAILKIKPFSIDTAERFTFANANITGNIESGNANLGNLAIANFFSGNGSALTSIVGANVSGQVGNALVASTVYTAAQPIITSVGTLTSLTVSGNSDLGSVANVKISGGSNGYVLKTDGSGNLSWIAASTGNANVGGSNSQVQFNNGTNLAGSANLTFDTTTNTLSATNFVGNGSGLTGIVASSGTATKTANGTSNVDIATASGNITMGVGGTAGVVTITTTGINANGYITASGNITGSYILGNGSSLSSITGANVTGAVAYATTANSVAGANVSGAVNLATFAGTANSVAGANVSGAVNLATFAGTANAVAGANVSGAVAYATTANSVAGANVSGQVANALVAGTVYTAAQPIITSVGTLTSVAVTGNLTAGNANISGTLTVGTITTAAGGSGNISGVDVISANFFSGSGNLLSNIQGANVTGAVGLATFAGTANAVAGANVSGAVAYATTANAVAGANVSGQVGNALVASTVYTNAQPNITSVGTLSNLAVTGNISAGNVLTNNLLYANGVAWSFGGGASISNGNSNVNIATSGGNINFSADGTANVMTITGTGANINGYANISGNVNAGNANLGNLVTANYFTGDGGLLSNIAPSSSLVSGNSNVKVSTSSDISFSMNGTSNVVVLTSLGANINGYANITGNVTFGNLIVSTYANLGSVSGLTITGGSNNYVLQTNGNGALSWAPLGALVTLDTFSGNGVQTTFTLSTTPATINHTIININGVQQFKNSYSLTGNSVIFSEAPPNTSYIEITTFAQRPTVAGYINRKYIGNGSANTYTVTAGCGENDVLVFLNGLCQMPVDGYTISGSSLTFSFAISAGTEIQIRELPR